jgi:hypothetical protein
MSEMTLWFLMSAFAVILCLTDRVQSKESVVKKGKGKKGI